MQEADATDVVLRCKVAPADVGCAALLLVLLEKRHQHHCVIIVVVAQSQSHIHG
jgi:hypothetical protein